MRRSQTPTGSDLTLTPSFCQSHQTKNVGKQQAWLLQRDITYALIFPLLDIYGQARETALAMTGGQPLEDLELVFSGEARGAFGWLQCFLAAESEWCAATGCPGKPIKEAI